MTIVFRALLGAAGAGEAPTPPEFSPDDLANLALWLDASDASSISLNGSDVSQWADKSDDARHFSQATALQQPEYVTNAHNGLAALRFTGAEELHGNTAAKNLYRNVAAVTAYAVCLTTDNTASRHMFWGSHAEGSSIRLSLVVSATFKDHAVAYRRNDADSVAVYRTGVEWPEDQLILLGVHHDWQSQVGRIYQNGTLLEDATLTTTAGLAPNTASGSIRIGSDNGAQRWSGDVCELLVYQATHNDTDRQKVENYLMSKWGIS